jgi:hypothetical protein
MPTKEEEARIKKFWQEIETRIPAPPTNWELKIKPAVIKKPKLSSD